MTSSPEKQIYQYSGISSFVGLRQNWIIRVSGQKQAKEQILWHKPFTQILDDQTPPFYKWFNDGELNVSYNCLIDT